MASTDMEDKIEVDMKHSTEEDQESKMMTDRMSSIRELMWTTLDDLSEKDLKRFKNILRNSCKIPWGRLENADSEEIVEQMVQKHRVKDSPKIMLTILKKMDKNQLATDLESKLGKDWDAAHTVLSKESLKQKLREHLKNRFSVVHQESGEDSVQDIYTDLYIVKGRTGAINRTHEVSTIPMRQTGRGPISADAQLVLDKMFTYATKVLTLGIAGVGKTIAVQKFVMDWAEKNTNLDIDFVFPLLFRELNLKKKKHYSLFDLLQLFYPNLKDLRNFPQFSRCKILFVFDGLDESTLNFKVDIEECISEPEEKSSLDILITSLIKGMLLPSALIWVTTRPAAASLIPPECFTLVTEVRGFTDTQKDKYFQKNMEKEKAEKVIEHVNKNRSLHTMCYIPVFCHIVACVLKEVLEDQSKGEPANTLTEMYTCFSVFQISRMDEKYLKRKKMSAKRKGRLLVQLGKLAFKHLEKGTLIFYKKDLKECDIDVKSAALKSGVCTQIFKKESAITGESIFSFVHLSVQEFLAALYVLHKGVHWANPFLKTWRERFNWLFTHSRFDLYRFAVEKALQSQSGHLDLFVRFLLGLALMLEPEIRSPLNVVLPQLAAREVSIEKTVEYIKEKIREDISPEKTINLFHCLNELGDNSLIEEIKRYRDSADEEKNLTPAQCSALAYLLLMSAEDLDEFDLKKYLKSEEGLCRMLPVVKVSKRVWLNQCRLSKASCTKMASVLQGTASILKELDMSDNYLQDEGMDLLCVGLRDAQCKMETLRLNRCDFSKASCEMIASTLQRTSSYLRELAISGNKLQDEGVELLCVGLRDPQCKMKTLRLDDCGLSKASCEMMASVLQGTSSHLTELDMSDNDLQDEGMELLCVGLRDPQCKLETLRLSRCLITHKGCSLLASALKSNPSYLKQLDLSYNHPGDSGVRELTDCKLGSFKYDHGGECRSKPTRKYGCEVTLDPDTAHRSLSLSDGNRKVTRVRKDQPCPDHPERFDYSDQVMCREGLSGRCYWEAEWSGSEVHIAVAYKSIKRKGMSADCGFGRNDKSWRLECCGNSYSAGHNNNKSAIRTPSSRSSRVGVYLDWQAGTLSFFSVSSDTLTLLHTFQSTFTEPLYPGFYVNLDSSVSLCQIT